MILCGDNLKIMRGMDNESIDLIYLDPPFNSNANYKGSNGSEFKDKWSVDDVDTSLLREIIRWYPKVNDLIKLASDTHSVSMSSYLAYMGIRIIEMEKLLNDTGSIYLHCDPTSSHYLRLLMDAVFGSKNFRNEIIWSYRGMPNKSKCFQRKHDTILFYGKPKSKFNIIRQNPTKESLATYKSAYNRGYNINRKRKMVTIFDKEKYDKAVKSGVIPSDLKSMEFTGGNPPMRDCWDDIKILGGPNNKERSGYPTQKPIALLERIIKASSNEADIILDPFCGSGTTLVAAKKLGRRFIGIDISESAISLAKKRTEKLEDLFT